MTRDIDDFADDLRDVQLDSQMEWAAVAVAEPALKESAVGGVDPGDDDANVEGLALTYEQASGVQFRRWYPKPVEWEARTNNLVLLLAYWDLDPGDLHKLNGDETFEVPMAYRPGRDAWGLDWPAIERTAHTRELEAGDDGE